ncbi:transglutaminase superfamily protein [Metamycoplasma alkalescens]|uniref:Transglutaminase superfamily protein n=6 Tax=Metamycoplasma alkalescens TaxID=45363 RepID=A0A318UJN3_9BACT|nr:transglutaminase domain-containing protein [Metamycoplasma alkalescens]PYF43623.1 transglutaminase superfamily protein [Metamycoplasma alkalescens]
MILSDTYAWNYFSHPNYVFENDEVTVSGDGENFVKLKLLDAKTKQEVTGVKWFQRIKYPINQVFAANEDKDSNTILTLTSSGEIKGKSHQQEHGVTEVWAEYQGYLYRCLVHVRSDAQTKNDDEIKKAEAEAEKIVKDWKDFSTLEKIKKAHEWMVTNVIYEDRGNLRDDQTAYSSLVEKRSICTGYANGFKMLMEKMNIPCIMVTGQMDLRIHTNHFERHAWNLVGIDGQWYHVDTTSDRSPEWKNDSSKIRYDFFLIHDKDFSRGQQFSHNYGSRLGQRFRNLKLKNFVKNVDDALAIFDQKYGNNSLKIEKDKPWLDIYGDVTLSENIKDAFKKRGLEIDKENISNLGTSRWMSYKKIRYSFKNLDFDKKQIINIKAIKEEISNKKLGKYAIKLEMDSDTIDLKTGNFIVKNAMINNIEKVNDGYILYFDNFSQFGENEIDLEIRKYGFKFDFASQNKFTFNVEKHNTPNATIKAIGPNSIVLSGVDNGMEYRNTFGEWKDITHDNFKIENVILGDILIRVKDNFDKFKSDIQVISLPKAGDVNNKIKVFDNTIIGVDNTMGFRVKDQGSWMQITTTKLKNLPKNIYEFRVKGNNNTLASESYIVTL